MASLIDKIVIVDIEATCWKEEPPPTQESDIIEIGVVTLDVGQLHLDAKRSILVKPSRSAVSDFCTELTSLTREQVQEGLPLAEACSLLHHEYESKDRLWASYGGYDRRMFERCCTALGVPYPFGHDHLNVKSLFAVSLGLPYEVGLNTALGKMGMQFVGKAHRGDDDALNVGRLLAKLLELGRRQQRRYPIK